MSQNYRPEYFQSLARRIVKRCGLGPEWVDELVPRMEFGYPYARVWQVLQDAYTAISHQTMHALVACEEFYDISRRFSAAELAEILVELAALACKAERAHLWAGQPAFPKTRYQALYLTVLLEAFLLSLVEGKPFAQVFAGIAPDPELADIEVVLHGRTAQERWAAFQRLKSKFQLGALEVIDHTLKTLGLPAAMDLGPALDVFRVTHNRISAAGMRAMMQEMLREWAEQEERSF